MKNSVFVFFLLIMVFNCPAQRAQKNNEELIPSSQTVHVHFDKDIYMPGETIWFKAYLYAAIDNGVTATNFYAAIYDDKGNLLQQKLYPIIGGCSNGNFQIPDTTSTTRIQFRAFTKAMILVDTNNVYTNILAIYNKENDSKAIVQSPIKTLQFYPEGGQMIAALENQIYFKASYNDGRKAIINGQIIDKETSSIVDTFFTDNSGIGRLAFIPYPNRNYIAVWKNDYGNLVQTPLPTATKFGATFHATVNGNEVAYSIVKNKNSDTLNYMHLIGAMNGYKLYAADLAVPNEREFAEGKFSIAGLPSGLLQLTLYNDLWQPLQQRAVLINAAANTSVPQIIVDTINTKSKGKNTIDISLTDGILTNLSVSVADLNFYPENRMHSMQSDILFNNELSSTSENIDSLLSKKDNDAIDKILLTHLWKPNDYINLKEKKNTPPHVVDDYISLIATVNEKSITVPQNDTLNMMVMTKNAEKQFYSFNRINSKNFKITNLVFYDTVRANCRLQKNKDLSSFFTIKKENEVSIPLHVAALPTLANNTSFKHVDTFFITKHNSFNDIQTIGEVVVKSKKRIVTPKTRMEELDEEYTTGFFRGNTKATQFNLIDDTTAGIATVDLQQYLRYHVPNLVVSKITGNLCVPVATPLGMVLKPVPVFIDETETELDYAALTNLYTSNFAYIKYIEGIVIGSSNISTVGALYIYTKKGNEKGPVAKRLSFNYLTGYNSPQQFTSPDYSDKTLLSTPDKRPTLYWNPDITLDRNNNKITIDFYNNDVSKKMLLTVEGINANGKIIHLEKILE